MSVPIFQVDAFTDRCFAGNPAAVCLLSGPGETAWMQDVAAEMNLSETAFLFPRADGYDLRWFTPTVEVELCGHATLASAHVLWETARLAAGRPARFHTRSGALAARREGDWIVLDFPAYGSEPARPPADLVEGLGASPVAVSLARNGHNYVVELESEQAVRELAPDIRRFEGLTAGVIATAPGDDPQVDFVSRYFAPAFGVDEDPVTGSTHCVLGPYWRERLGRDDLSARQVSRRGGALRIRLEGERAFIAGQAVTVLSGELGQVAVSYEPSKVS